jgi:hypothetical protein
MWDTHKMAMLTYFKGENDDELIHWLTIGFEATVQSQFERIRSATVLISLGTTSSAPELGLTSTHANHHPCSDPGKLIRRFPIRHGGTSKSIQIIHLFLLDFLWFSIINHPAIGVQSLKPPVIALEVAQCLSKVSESRHVPMEHPAVACEIYRLVNVYITMENHHF